ncbi:MBOAT family protein [Thalassotalea euphylliae]|uniref:Probable alginate O-acetylase n=1 Tax=Thalassotalea euphylliae TaxID=1655234 RepID=A0A3E0TLI7_9GAMM|nr:MBOAT family protein [Thalassotalea euphylliae]REL25207.1 MBOAT family protein [Thalassotalea euphylliae]
MLFNSFEFIFIFLPITFILYYLIAKQNWDRIAVAWLVLASLFFYAWWNPSYLILIIFSMLFNYSMGVVIARLGNARSSKLFLVIGVSINLALLGYFKYTNFIVEQINWALGNSFHLEKIILPLAISFFTFQQIAYLVDTYRHETKEYNFSHYCLFVTFFPQLIAGPIVHHKEMLPQFSNALTSRVNSRNMSIGLTIFTIGLFKKVILADNVALSATPIFDAAGKGAAITFFEAWGGAIAYTLQLYFDFSGYSDMAIGIAFMFGIQLPINFNSPYKAVSIIDFWRRWHITLSRFLRDYLYIALGGNRHGNTRRYLNLFLTMLLGGIWHGAGWTFIVWGMLHGSYLMINHGWRKLRKDVLNWSDNIPLWEHVTARIITLLAVIVGWVYFRAETLAGANHMIATMTGFNGLSLPQSMQSIFGSYAANLSDVGVIFEGMFGGYKANFVEGIVWIIALTPIALFAPNSMQIANGLFSLNLGQLTVNTYHRIKPNHTATLNYIAWLAGVTFGIIILNLFKVSEFLYFQF